LLQKSHYMIYKLLFTYEDFYYVLYIG
jgi:hypothetical protein